MEMILCGCGCGQLRSKYDNRGRERKYVYHHNTRGKMAGENHPMYGRKASLETRKKMSKAQMGYKHTEEAKQKMAKIQMGEKNSNWKGDAVTDGTFRERARKIYQNHHKVTFPAGVVIHHIDGDVTNNDISNLKAMWHVAHMSLHNEWRRRWRF